MGHDPHILIVEDDAEARDTLITLLEQEGYRLSSAHGIEAGLQAIRERVFDVVVVVDMQPASRVPEPSRLIAAADPTPVGLIAAADMDSAPARFAFRVSADAPPSFLLQQLAAATSEALPPGTAEQECVSRYFRALEERDWAALGSLVDARVTYALEGTAEVVEGAAAFQRYSAETFSRFQQAKFRDLAVFRTPNGAAARYRGEWRDPDGRPQAIAGAVVFAIEGGLIRKIGVRLDLDALAGSAAWNEHVAAQTISSPRLAGFSTRQVAQLLGMGEASVKRLADAGGIGCVRQPGRTVRRFAPAHIVEYLRKSGAPHASSGDDSVPARFRDAARAGDLSTCVALAVEAFGRATPLERILDDLVVPCADEAAEGLVAALSARLSALFVVDKKHHTALVVPAASKTAASLCECALRGRGFEALTPIAGMSPGELATLALRSRAKIVVVAADSDSSAAMSAATVIASAVPAKVLVYSRCATETAPGPRFAVARSLERLTQLARAE